MTLSFQFIAAGIAVFVFAVIGIILLIPAQRSQRRGKKAPKSSSLEQPGKDWEAVSLRLERHIQALRREIEDQQKKERSLERDLTVQKGKYHQLKEKLAQERDWQKKEEDEFEKKVKEIASLKNDLRKAENELNTTHTHRLRFERDLRDAKSEIESVNLAKRNLELQLAKSDAENENHRKLIKDLKWENSQLVEKKDAESWVPKEDYEKLELELRNKDKDLTRLREQMKKEI